MRGHQLFYMEDCIPIYHTVIRHINTLVRLKEGSVISEGGEVIIPASGETALDIARASVVEKSGVIIGGDLNIVKVNKEIIPSFLAIMISNGSRQKELAKKAQGKSIVHIHNSDLKLIEIIYPTVNEQEKIWGFFNTLDKLITLHQRKLEQLEQLKNTLLSKMFPKSGTNIPEIRFSGFTDAWKQRKLENYLSVPSKEQVKNMNELKLMTVKLNLEGINLSANRKTLDLGSTNYFIRHAGQLIYGKQNFFNGSIAIVPIEAEGYSTSGDVPSFNVGNINKEFLYTFISRKNYYKHKENVAKGTGSKRIHEKDFLNFDISVPTIIEQNLIADFFRNINNTITIHQRKLEQLKNLKQTLLNKMFI